MLTPRKSLAKCETKISMDLTMFQKYILDQAHTNTPNFTPNYYKRDTFLDIYVSFFSLLAVAAILNQAGFKTITALIY